MKYWKSKLLLVPDLLLYLLKSGIFAVLSLPIPLNGESNELVSRLATEVESARTGIEGTELRGSVRNSVREVCVREAMVGEECCGQLRLMDRL